VEGVSRDTTNFQTPKLVCERMAGILRSYGKAVYGGSVLEPTPGRGNLVTELQTIPGCQVVVPEKDFWDAGIQDAKYNAVVGNPPFSPMSVGYKILFRCMDISDVVIMIVPWLTFINSDKRAQKIMEYGLRAVIHLPRTVFRGSRIQCCILSLNRGYRGHTELSYLNYSPVCCRGVSFNSIFS
jgi:hypothetical protein